VGRIVVIGGGPGGSCAATMLARSGHSVLVLEREHFPRDHVGESLLPASVPILEALGVRDEVEASGALRKWGATMVWGREREPWSWYFRETNTTYPHAYQVWRPTFDQILLRNAAAAGAEVREGVRVTSVLVEPGEDAERVVGLRWVDETGVEGVERPDLVLDASGQAAVVGRALGLRRFDRDFRNMAVYAYYDGAGRLDPPDETNILVEAYADGWCWVIPLPGGRASVGAVVDQGRAAGGGVRGDDLAGFLDAELTKTDHARRLLAGARRERDRAPVALRDWSYVSDRVVGDGFILVGDAACFVDPLFSSGVHLALTAGMLAAAYVTTALDDTELGAAARPVYQELYYSQYGRFHEMAKLFYASNRTDRSHYWKARRALGAVADGGDKAARLAFVRAVAGQPPQGYERAVLAQGELPAEFAAAVDAVEAELARRKATAVDLGDRLGAAVPVGAADTRIERRPVLEGDRFVWGHSLVSASRTEGVPLSPLVAALVNAIDGARTVDALIGDVLGPLGIADQRREPLAENLRFALVTLFVDGAIAELRVGTDG